MPEMDLEDQLLAQAVAGHRAALGRLLFLHYDQLAGHVGARLPSAFQSLVGVEDILQQTFACAFRSIDQLQARSVRKFSAWLQVIAENEVGRIVDSLLARKRGGGLVRITGLSADSSDSLAELYDLVTESGNRPSRQAARAEAVQAIQIGIASLPESQRQAIHLRHIEGRALDEAAMAMQRTPAAVRGLLHRAKQALKTAMGRSSRWFTKK